MKLEANARIQIQKPVEEVFEGIVDHSIMCKYFISESSGRLDSGKEVMWKFPEFPEQFPVNAIKIEANHSISFVWDIDAVVTITLENIGDKNTLVHVNEKKKEFSEENVVWALRNTEGWANFLACMKAYLEYGIELRKGAFDFMKKD